MTSRERVIKVINHETPDRMPIDLGGTRGTSINVQANSKLRRYLDLSEKELYLYDFPQQLAYPDLDMLDRLHIDVIDGGQAFRQSRENCFSWKFTEGQEALVPDYFNVIKESENTYLLKDPSGEAVVAKKEPSAHYFHQSYYVYGNEAGIPDDINRVDLKKNLYGIPLHPWNLDFSNEAELSEFHTKIKNLYDTTDYAIALTIGCQIFEMGQYIRGTENFFCDLYIDEKGVRRLLDSLLEMYMEKIKKVIDTVGDYIFTLRFVDDLGSQQGPLVDPLKYRELIKPYHKHMWQYIHDNSNVKVTLHSCGSVKRYLPDLIDAGVDILNPVQTSAFEMDPIELKKEFGKDIVFWGGGCDTQKVLPNGSPEEVKEHVKSQIDALNSGGGMIFSQIHNIQPEVPPENITAMLQTAYEG